MVSLVLLGTSGISTTNMNDCVLIPVQLCCHITMQEAVIRTREVFGDNHPKYAECLTDLGYYLLNVDQIGKSLKAYETALKVIVYVIMDRLFVLYTFI